MSARAALALTLLALGGCGAMFPEVVAEMDRIDADVKVKQRACDAGDRNTCYALGKQELAYYEDPKGLYYRHAILRENARRHLERACELELAKACFDLGGFEYDAAMKRGHARRACDLGFGAGCIAALEGADRSLGDDQVRAMATRACDLDAETCPDAALSLRSRFRDKSVDLETPLLERPCDVGNAAACARAAERGRSEELRDRLNGRACDLDSPEGCFALAKRWEPVEPPKAQEFFRRACSAGSDNGCAAVGRWVTAQETARLE
jgi:TPR repeat protein